MLPCPILIFSLLFSTISPYGTNPRLSKLCQVQSHWQTDFSILFCFVRDISLGGVGGSAGSARKGKREKRTLVDVMGKYWTANPSSDDEIRRKESFSFIHSNTAELKRARRYEQVSSDTSGNALVRRMCAVVDLQRFLEETTGGEGSGGIILHGPRQSGKTSLILNVLTFLSNNPDHVRSPTHILTRPPVQQRQRRITQNTYRSIDAFRTPMPVVKKKASQTVQKAKPKSFSSRLPTVTPIHDNIIQTPLKLEPDVVKDDSIIILSSSPPYREENQVEIDPLGNSYPTLQSQRTTKPIYILHDDSSTTDSGFNDSDSPNQITGMTWEELEERREIQQAIKRSLDPSFQVAPNRVRRRGRQTLSEIDVKPEKLKIEDIPQVFQEHKLEKEEDDLIIVAPPSVILSGDDSGNENRTEGPKLVVNGLIIAEPTPKPKPSRKPKSVLKPQSQPKIERKTARKQPKKTPTALDQAPTLAPMNTPHTLPFTNTVENPLTLSSGVSDRFLPKAADPSPRTLALIMSLKAGDVSDESSSSESRSDDSIYISEQSEGEAVDESSDGWDDATSGGSANDDSSDDSDDSDSEAQLDGRARRRKRRRQKPKRTKATKRRVVFDKILQNLETHWDQSDLMPPPSIGRTRGKGSSAVSFLESLSLHPSLPQEESQSSVDDQLKALLISAGPNEITNPVTRHSNRPAVMTSDSLFDVIWLDGREMKDPSAAFSCVMEQLESQRRQREEAEEEQMNTAFSSRTNRSTAVSVMSEFPDQQTFPALQTPFHPNRSTTHTMDTLATRASDLTPQLLPSRLENEKRGPVQTFQTMRTVPRSVPHLLTLLAPRNRPLVIVMQHLDEYFPFDRSQFLLYGLLDFSQTFVPGAAIVATMTKDVSSSFEQRVQSRFSGRILRPFNDYSFPLCIEHLFHQMHLCLLSHYLFDQDNPTSMDAVREDLKRVCQCVGCWMERLTNRSKEGSDIPKHLLSNLPIGLVEYESSVDILFQNPDFFAGSVYVNSNDILFLKMPHNGNADTMTMRLVVISFFGMDECGKTKNSSRQEQTRSVIVLDKVVVQGKLVQSLWYLLNKEKEYNSVISIFVGTIVFYLIQVLPFHTSNFITPEPQPKTQPAPSKLDLLVHVVTTSSNTNNIALITAQAISKIVIVHPPELRVTLFKEKNLEIECKDDAPNRLIAKYNSSETAQSSLLKLAKKARVDAPNSKEKTKPTKEEDIQIVIALNKLTLTSTLLQNKLVSFKPSKDAKPAALRSILEWLEMLLKFASDDTEAALSLGTDLFANLQSLFKQINA
ncbi:hypothetical protein BLNAU_22317 [Blattamonas nauphoetae]|uniref:Origin recognition complex subunit 1 n=1 Tax=Blattamonas nauphoetae TaxID=2049346 RepID=A0ABQ9WVL3_9EUKA|nr:hypothetical protein BLNAU_22317 [Blattamonas nauphoetae]